MDLFQIINKKVSDSNSKNILEVGAHDDSLSIKLAQMFKHVYAYYEYVKIPERTEKNLTIKKVPYLEVLNEINRFDVLLMENEFHHFPDIWQMQTYDRLSSNQQLILVEWDFTGNVNQYYQCFQDCKPLCHITRDVVSKFQQKNIIQIDETIKGKYENDINNRQEMIDFFKFTLPDHWKYGEADFMKKIETVKYPIKLWEGYDLFIISKKNRK